MTPVYRIALLILVLILGIHTTRAEEESKKVLTAYPHMTVDLEKKELRIEAVSSKELLWGNPPLEFPIMSVREKAYETLFLTQANPVHINLGLILMGLHPAPLPEKLLKNPGKPKKYPEDMPPLLTMDVEWKDKGKTHRVNFRKFIFYRTNDNTPEEFLMAFTGSFFTKTEDGKNVLVAGLTGEVASLIYNPQALLNLSYNEPSPYLEDGKYGFYVEISSLPDYFKQIKEMEIHGKGMVKRQTIREAPVTLILREVKK